MNHLVILAFQTLPTIYCLPTPNEPQEEDDFYKTYVHIGGRLDINITDPPTLQNNIYITCDRMRRLDKILTSMYEDPPENGGEELMKLSRTYNQACLDLLHLCTINKWKALEAARDMLEYGGAKFLEVDIDEKKMQERFKWDEDMVESIHVIRGRSHEHWYDLWHLYQKLPE